MNSFICKQLNGFKYCYIILIIQFNINPFAHINFSNIWISCIISLSACVCVCMYICMCVCVHALHYYYYNNYYYTSYSIHLYIYSYIKMHIKYIYIYRERESEREIFEKQSNPKMMNLLLLHLLNYYS